MRFAPHRTVNKMADEQLDLEQLDTEIEKENKIEKRIKDLSEKVRLTAEERDELKRLDAEKDAKIANMQKENEFLNSFGNVLGKNPEAANYKDAIKDRVLKGYSVEDATISVLVSEGKYAPPKKEIEIDSPAGGSAVTQHPPTGEKSPSELSRDEKRQKLIEAEKRGDLSTS